MQIQLMILTPSVLRIRRHKYYEHFNVIIFEAIWSLYAIKPKVVSLFTYSSCLIVVIFEFFIFFLFFMNFYQFEWMNEFIFFSKKSVIDIVFFFFFCNFVVRVFHSFIFLYCCDVVLLILIDRLWLIKKFVLFSI